MSEEEIGETEEEQREREVREEKEKERHRELIKKIVYGTIGGTIAMATFLLVAGTVFDNRTAQGTAIVIFAILIIIAVKGIGIPKAPHVWVIEFFGKYYDTWKPRYFPYFLIPEIMRVKDKIPFKSTIVIRNYMDGKEHIHENGEKEITPIADFKDDSAEIILESAIEVIDEVKATYNVTIPGGYRAITEKTVNSIFRGICGRRELEKAIEARTVPLGLELIDKENSSDGEKEKLKKEYIESLVGELETQADKILKPYGVNYISALIKDVVLHKDTEEKRRQIQLAKKEIEVQTHKVESERLTGEQEGQKKSKEITEIIRLVKKETGETLEPLQVMTYIRQKDLFETAGKGTLIATSGGLEKGIADVGAIAAGLSSMLKKKGSE
jgi:regulator of protease activity HflC (stomatin/prohibitin superfamily)